jgi:hypothetical protein
MRKNTSKKGKAYSHLSLQDREEIAIALEQGKSKRPIARMLGRAPRPSPAKQTAIVTRPYAPSETPPPYPAKLDETTIPRSAP